MALIRQAGLQALARELQKQVFVARFSGVLFFLAIPFVLQGGVLGFFVRMLCVLLSFSKLPLLAEVEIIN
jgi:hypothetical protein